MPETVISDASVLILFRNLNHFSILKDVYGKLYVTDEIALEFGENLPDWITIQAVTDVTYQNFLETQLDAGEASAMALAKQLKNPLLILDDLKARKLARQLRFKFTGSLGVIHRAKKIGIISEVKPIIDKILKTDFRISQKIVDEILKLNDEL